MRRPIAAFAAAIVAWCIGAAAPAAPPEAIEKLELRTWLIANAEAGGVAVLAFRMRPDRELAPPGVWDARAVVDRLQERAVDVRSIVLTDEIASVVRQPPGWPTRITHREINGPGLYAFKDLELVAFCRGEIDPTRLIEFLDTAIATRSLLDERRHELDRRRGDLIARINTSQPFIVDLVNRGIFEEAIDRIDDLWHESIPAQFGLAESAHAKLRLIITEIVRHSGAARAHFAALRDASEARLRAGTATGLDLYDWLLLSGALGDIARITAWVDRVGDTREARRLLNDPELDLFGTLVDAGEWKVAGGIILYPVETAQTLASIVPIMHAGEPVDVLASLESHIRVQIGEVYAACLVADRLPEAARIVATMRDAGRLDAMLRVSLVLAAADARASLPEHLDWLADAEREGLTLPDGLKARVGANLEREAKEQE